MATFLFADALLLSLRICLLSESTDPSGGIEEEDEFDFEDVSEELWSSLASDVSPPLNGPVWDSGDLGDVGEKSSGGRRVG